MAFTVRISQQISVKVILTSKQPKSVCDVCSQLISAMASTNYEQKPEPDLTWDIGLGHELLVPYCQWHTPIIELAIDDGYCVAQQKITLLPDEGPSIYLQGATFNLASTSGDIRTSGTRRLLKEWIDTDLLRQWKHACTCEHLSLVPDLSHIRPKLLIDTHQNCLKWNSSGDSYLALSYVWGQVPTLKTTTATLDQLLQVGALHTPEIPATIAHAILLTRELEERYLWVDALCIIQDDRDFLAEEINNMAAIYSNAKVTIIAARGQDAGHGLRGIRGCVPRTPLKTFGLPDSSFIVRNLPESATAVEHTPWGTRGWTFQEDLFSTRKIIFKDETVEWRCCCSSFREFDCPDPWTPQPPEAGDRSHYSIEDYQDHLIFFNSLFPDYEFYQKLVSLYSLRSVSFPEDIHATFAGITRTLARSFPGGFIYGLPVTFFDSALLWDFADVGEATFDGPTRRRIPVDPKKQMPSWSWMGWHGETYMRMATSHIGPKVFSFRYLHDEKHTGTSRITNAVQWYSISPAGSKHKIISNWNKYQEIGNSDTLEPPPGWTRHQAHKMTRARFYTSIHAPDEDFLYPVPFACDESPFVHPESTTIWCRTQRCFLQVRPTEVEYGYPKLFDSSNTLVGHLNYLFAENRTNIPTTTTPNTTTDTVSTCLSPITVELVAISQGRCAWEDYQPNNNYDDARDDYEEDAQKEFNYYNVLSIEWMDGVAYRTAVGTVRKEEWERQALEWVDLTLA